MRAALHRRAQRARGAPAGAHRRGRGSAPRANAATALQIALSYGGRWDIVAGGAPACARNASSGALRAGEIDEERFAGALALAGLPDPDLFIRTGGEQRISNFLLWNLAYTELYFTDCLWPDFDAGGFEAALAFFAGARAALRRARGEQPARRVAA